MKPTLTVSGYRGIWGDTLTPDIAREYVRAFGAFVAKRDGRKILVGRDGRESGPELVEVVAAELLAAGFEVVDLDMMPTPVVLFLIKSQKADGAVIVTASHNPIEYNGLKFVTSTGAFTTESEVAEIKALRTAPSERAVSTRPGAGAQAPSRPTALTRDGLPFETALSLGAVRSGTHLFEKYLAVLLSHIDIDAIKNKNFKVAFDPINSVGCTTTPKLLDALGITHTSINSEPTGKFAHAPEPIAQNLKSLENLVLVAKSDVGFAQDPDGDRLVLVDETGTILSEEMTLALSLKAVLAKTPGDVVINAVTSTMSADIVENSGGKVFRSKVGEANVVEAMREHSAIAGGEGSGGVIWPAVNAARDSFVGMALVLELMAKEDKPLSKIVESLPKYSMVKEKAPRTGDLDSLYARLRAAFPEADADTTDGLRLDLPDRSWINARPSNTEPIIRIFAEAKTNDQALALSAKAKGVLS